MRPLTRLVAHAVPAPVRRAAAVVAALGTTVPAEAQLYVALLAEERPPPTTGLQVLRRRTAVTRRPALAGIVLKD